MTDDQNYASMTDLSSVMPECKLSVYSTHWIIIIMQRIK